METNRDIDDKTHSLSQAQWPPAKKPRALIWVLFAVLVGGAAVAYWLLSSGVADKKAAASATVATPQSTVGVQLGQSAQQEQRKPSADAKDPFSTEDVQAIDSLRFIVQFDPKARANAEAKQREATKLAAAPASRSAEASPAPAPTSVAPRVDSNTAPGGPSGPTAPVPPAATDAATRAQAAGSEPPTQLAAARTERPAPEQVQELRVIARPAPVFPPEAHNDGITSGRVIARLTVEPDGSVSQVQIVQANPPRVFNRAAEQALRRWRFAPIERQRQANVELSFVAD